MRRVCQVLFGIAALGVAASAPVAPATATGQLDAVAPALRALGDNAGLTLAARRKRDTVNATKTDTVPPTPAPAAPLGGLGAAGSTPGSLLPSSPLLPPLPLTPLPPTVGPATLPPLDTSPRRTLADCMKLWERATHMTKAEWRATCQRSIKEHERSIRSAKAQSSLASDIKGEPRRRRGVKPKAAE